MKDKALYRQGFVEKYKEFQALKGKENLNLDFQLVDGFVLLNDAYVVNFNIKNNLFCKSRIFIFQNYLKIVITL